MSRKKRPIIINSFPPMLKVSGDLILSLFEVEDNNTVKNKLGEWGVQVRSGYVLTQEILEYLNQEPSEIIESYKPKTEASAGL